MRYQEDAVIVCGDPSRFAVKWEATFPGEQPIGRFALVVMGDEVGDFSDNGTSLIGCYNWTADLLHHVRDRFEPGLFEMDRGQAFETLVHPVFGHYYGVECPPEPYADIYGRFHIQHIGMTSMEKFVLLLIQNEQGESRLIWQEDYGEIREACFDAGEVEDVLADFLVRAHPDMPLGNTMVPLS